MHLGRSFNWNSSVFNISANYLTFSVTVFDFCELLLQVQFSVSANYVPCAETVFFFSELILYKFPVGG